MFDCNPSNHDCGTRVITPLLSYNTSFFLFPGLWTTCWILIEITKLNTTSTRGFIRGTSEHPGACNITRNMKRAWKRRLFTKQSSFLQHRPSFTFNLLEVSASDSQKIAVFSLTETVICNSERESAPDSSSLFPAFKEKEV